MTQHSRHDRYGMDANTAPALPQSFPTNSQDSLQELQHQLEAARRNLQSFTHTITHDLRSPLGQIDGFAFLLGMEYADAMDAKAQSYLQHIREAAKRMTTLINELSELMRICEAPVASQPLDISDMARAIVVGYTPQPNVEFAIAPGLAATADAALTRIVLENLLRNACQFAAKQEQAKIELGMQHGEPPVFFVRDNGVGFDLPPDALLFARLQRLNSLEDFDGTGMRYATAERAVQRQGGRIWAECASGAGATFYFTLHA